MKLTIKSSFAMTILIHDAQTVDPEVGDMIEVFPTLGRSLNGSTLINTEEQADPFEYIETRSWSDGTIAKLRRWYK